MITQPAKVIATSDSYCLVETIPKSACPRCAEGKGCGGGILAQAFANKTYQIKVAYSTNLDGKPVAEPSVDEQVLIAMSSNGLLLASMVMYLVPLLLMIISALLASFWFGSADIYTVSGAVIGMTIGALGASRLSRLLISSGVTQAHLIEFNKTHCWYPAA